MSIQRRPQASMAVTQGEERSLKRQRTETNGSVDFVRDKDYYFDDGNIILVAEDTAFKVHKSVLSRHSVVFRDMFLLANGNSSSSESHENCDVLRPSDSKQDMVCLLRALYDVIAPHELTELSCLLRISHKYLIYRLLKRTLETIEKAIPITYEDYKASVMTLGYTEYGHDELNVAAAAITIGVDIFFPILYYKLLTFSDPYELEKLPASSLAKILTGVRPTTRCLSNVVKIVKARPFASNTTPHVYSAACREAWEEFTSILENFIAKPDRVCYPIDYIIHIMHTQQFPGECSLCRTARIDLLDAEAKKFWDELPKIYYVAENWDELRERYAKLKEPGDEDTSNSQSQ